MPRPLLFTAGAVAALIATPLFYILYRALTADPETWARLIETRLFELMLNTLSLMIAVTIGTTTLGTTLAWLVERTDLPWRNVWRWLLAVPLAIPPSLARWCMWHCCVRAAASSRSSSRRR